MKTTIHKFAIEVDDKQKVKMPQGARILSAKLQNGRVVLWAMVEPEKETVERIIHIFGTGHPVTTPYHKLRFIDTVLMMGGSLVWHIFEEV